jgi:hypothetical protein
MRAALLAAFILLHSAPAQAHPRPARTETGKVVYTTFGRAYLDCGGRQGLVAGATLSLQRQGNAVGTCRVEWVDENHATCVGEDVRRGDTFRSPPASARQPQNDRPRLSAQEIDRRRSALAQVPFLKVEAKPAAGLPGRRPKAEVTAGHQLWASFATPRGFHQERLDLTLSTPPFWGGLRFLGNGTVLWWSDRPATARYLPGTATQIWIRQAELTTHGSSSLELSAGRLWPWHAPGLVALDGAQLGWASSDRKLAAGIFGGALPDPVSLSPDGRWIAGAYYSAEHGEPKSTLRLRHNARIDVRRIDGAPLIEAQLEVDAQLGAWAETSFGVLGVHSGGAIALQSSHVDFSARPSATLTLAGSLRQTSSDPELLKVDPEAFDQRARHAELSARWAATPSLSLGMIGGTALEATTDLQRGYVGPEVALPRAFGRHGGLAVGYQQDFGWSQGRLGYVQLTGRAFSRLQLVGRISYLDSYYPAQPWLMRELGGFVSVRAQLTEFLIVRGSLLVRGGVGGNSASSEEGTAGRVGIIGGLALTGRL